MSNVKVWITRRKRVKSSGIESVHPFSAVVDTVDLSASNYIGENNNTSKISERWNMVANANKTLHQENFDWESIVCIRSFVH